MTNVVLSEIVSNHLTEEYPVNSEKLFLFLNNNSKYADWIQNRIKQYGFMKNEDFTIQILKTKGRPKKIYWITLDMAKELAMVENNEKGRQARKYFIEIEKKYKHKFYQPQLIENNEQMVEELIKRSDIVRGYQGQIAKLENELAKKQSDIKNLELQLSRPFELSGVKELLEVARQKDKKFQTLQLERNETINTIEKIVFPHIEKIENSIKALKEINSSLYRFLITN